MRFHITPDFGIHTDLLQLRFVLYPGLVRAQVRATVGDCTIALPATESYASAERQEWLNRVLVESLRWQAQRIVTPRVVQHAQRAGLSYGRITYKDVRTRWGSCSSLRNLNFSVWLLLAPSHLVDYVVCHELAHLSHLNHSAQFWNALDHLLGGEGEGKRLDREMNTFSRQLSRQGRWL